MPVLIGQENEGFALDGMADALDALGRIPEAIAALEQSLELRRRLAALDQRREALIALPQLEVSLGRLYASSGQRTRAEPDLRRAVALWEEVRLKQPQLYSAKASTQAVVSREGTTNETGYFFFPLVNPGRYEASAEKAGWRPQSVSREPDSRPSLECDRAQCAEPVSGRHVDGRPEHERQ